MTTQRAARALIFTADDFGLHPRVNAAVERAHRDGVLNAASLMVGASAAQDAIERARRLPSLAVGLHLVLADGPATLPASDIPALVGPDGRFGDAMAKDGCRFFFLPHVRAQLRREIRAQFDAFAASGLPLDHVNAHKHFHLHPTVLSMIIEIGRDYGLRAVRLPYEPSAPACLKPWIGLVRARLDRAGLAHNDYVVGIEHTGGMDEAVLLDALANALRDHDVPGTVATTAALGVPPQQVEALAFAWLAYRFNARASGNLAMVTGAAGERVLGALYPR